MDRLLFAAIADDDTGASDLAGMLAERGVRTLLIIDLPEPDRLTGWLRGFDAAVVAVGTRNIEADAARKRTAEAIHRLRPFAPRMFAIKYCSTFDSTERGNIGPAIDAAMTELGVDFTVAVPALPVNGRTTYMGHHFVWDKLLSDSPMRHHPLTPMRNPNLVDFLSRQTARRVGLAAYPAVDAGADRLRAEFDQLRARGVEIAIVDCLSDRHVETICRAAADLELITGSSAPGIGLPLVWRERGWLGEAGPEAPASEVARPAAGCLIIAGSCSEATRAQNAWLVEQGWRAIFVDPRDLISGRLETSRVVASAAEELEAARPVLVTTSAAPEQVAQVQAWAQAQGMTPEELGRAISSGLAALAHEILKRAPAAGLVAAGGETAGALCRGLALSALAVGRNIEPGVPLCRALGRFPIPVVLKSGNFGSRDFYGRALGAIQGPLEGDDSVRPAES
jgi:uncharacterized protein YgbK (DUF1537 family)